MTEQSEVKTLDFKEQAVLELMQRHFQTETMVFQTLDQKAQVVVGVSSIIITIITGFQLTTSAIIPQWQLLLILFSYCATIVLALCALLPRKVSHEPIKVEWEEYTSALSENNRDFYWRLLASYETAIKKNRKVNNSKANRVTLSFILLAFSVTLALFLAVTALPLPFVP